MESGLTNLYSFSTNDFGHGENQVLTLIEGLDGRLSDNS
jgi:hypothetical protein